MDRATLMVREFDGVYNQKKTNAGQKPPGARARRNASCDQCLVSRLTSSSILTPTSGTPPNTVPIFIFLTLALLAS